MDALGSRCSTVAFVAAMVVPLLVGEVAALKLSRTEPDAQPVGGGTHLYPCFSVYQIDLNETRLFTHIGSPESADCAYTFEAPEEASLELEVGNIAAAPSGGSAYNYGYSHSCGPQAVRIFDFRPDGALVVAATWCGWPVQGAALSARSSRNLAVVTSTVALGSFDLRVSAAPLPQTGNTTDLVPVSELLPPPPPSTAASTRGDTPSPPTEQEQPSAAPTAAAVEGVESETTTTTTTTTTSTTTAESVSEQDSPQATTAVPPRLSPASPPDESASNDDAEQSAPPSTAAAVVETSEDLTQPPPPLRSAASAL
ncbi:mucin-5AC-like [Schistocerca gregaria]|uniref:mucin-5AC-like n=1 Tax=Schistocerca gregaria TaxID=7010 RepID=UPI00211DDE98|nr:mucin-5AC-like [Schistocerca gregaria]